MQRLSMLLGAGFLLLAAYLVLWPTEIDPIAVKAPRNPGFSGKFERNDRLASARLVPLAEGTGPEDIALGPDGKLYTGLWNGWVVRWSPDDEVKQERFASTGGRPNGMEFDSQGNLIVADTLLGVFSIDPFGTLTKLLDSIHGVPLKLPNDVALTPDGRIWLTESSQQFGQSEIDLDFFDGRRTGRLISFHPADGRITVHLGGLGFANGLVVSPDSDYILICETMAYRVRRYWLRGPRAGTDDVFLDALPGFPDNISVDEQGRYWIALIYPRNRLYDSLSNRPFPRHVLFRSLRLLGASPERPRYGWVIAANEKARIVENLQDPSGRIGELTSANMFDGKLYLGNLHGPALGVWSPEEQDRP